MTNPYETAVTAQCAALMRFVASDGPRYATAKDVERANQALTRLEGKAINLGSEVGRLLFLRHLGTTGPSESDVGDDSGVGLVDGSLMLGWGGSPRESDSADFPFAKSVVLPRWLIWQAYGRVCDGRMLDGLASSMPSFFAFQGTVHAWDHVNMAAHTAILEHLGLYDPHVECRVVQRTRKGVRLVMLEWGDKKATVPLAMIIQGVCALLSLLPGSWEWRPIGDNPGGESVRQPADPAHGRAGQARR